MAPILRTEDGIEQVLRLGANPEMLHVNLMALDDVHGQPCSAGHNYLYIGIDCEVYPCSRYYVPKKDRLGNALDPEFRLDLLWGACQPGSAAIPMRVQDLSRQEHQERITTHTVVLPISLPGTTDDPLE
jgi:hypothetical protein